ncbi:MAG: glutamate racemase [Thiotrichales bacterium]|jgi:glutamate racemase|nr:glutamate racemase [Thiotrichales bacterium]
MLNAPIGVFDSGVGGLSVLKEIRALMPAEHLYYVADSGYAPYGDKSSDYIVARAELIVRFFLAQHVKAIVVACNTATSVAVDQLRVWCPVPIIAMEPAIKPAALHTKTGVVGVLATTQTIGSANVNRLIAQHGQDIKVLLRACAGFVEQVEAGALHGDVTRQLVRQHVQPLVDAGVDTLVLGCTHYPFLLDEIRAAATDAVHIIDPSAAIARQLQRKLTEKEALSEANQQGVDCFWTSGETAKVAAIVGQLWQQEVSVKALPVAG